MSFVLTGAADCCWNMGDILRGAGLSDILALKPGGHDGSGHSLVIAEKYKNVL